MQRKNIEELWRNKENRMERDYNALLAAGNKAQLEKLKKYKHKKGFDSIGVLEAFNRLQDEVLELDAELYNIDNKDGCIFKYLKIGIDVKKARHEFADIANFAHMGILACDKELENNERNA